MEHLSPEYIEENLNGIKAFVFKTQKTKAIKKMSQNKSDDYLQNVWPALEKDENGRILAEKMKKARKN
jgi:predicted FMN-binding regulatory protein PaiB